jgi:hypothetical protein
MLGAICLASLLSMLLSAVAAGRWGARGAVALGASSMFWLAFNKPMEGPVLVAVSHNHGFVAADVVGLAGLGVAFLLVFDSAR